MTQWYVFAIMSKMKDLHIQYKFKYVKWYVNEHMPMNCDSLWPKKINKKNL